MSPGIPSKLSVVIDLQPGETLSMKETGEIIRVPHNSWKTAYHRHRTGESRQTTLDYIDEILRQIEGPSLLVQLERCIAGLSNLQKTYSDDGLFLVEIEKRKRHIRTFVDIHRDSDVPMKPKKPLPGLKYLIVYIT